MRKLLVALILFLCSTGIFAQSVVVKYRHYGDPGYVNGAGNSNLGLYNERAQQWIKINCDYDDLGTLGSYNGRRYFAYELNGLCGVINDLGSVVIKAQWDGMGTDNWGVFHGFIRVRRRGEWGIIDLNNLLIISCDYKSVLSNDDGSFTLWQYDGGYVKYSVAELNKRRDEIIAAQRAAEEKKVQEERERQQREKKENELASFTEYARNYVEPRINEWQKKGEFEKLAEYQNRVTGPNRSAKIDELTYEAEKLFIAENADLKPESAPMILDVYDSENEVFHLTSEKLGSLIVPVPIAEGPDFKKHFSFISRKNPVYYIDNDKIALASMEFYDPISKKTYTYNNSRALNYNHYEIDPGKYTFELVNVVNAKPAASQTAAVAKKPIIKFLSPADKSQYSSSEVTVRYQAKVFDGSTPTLRVWINGIEVSGVQNNEVATDKGVAPAYQEIVLTLPREKERPCGIMLEVVDGSGYPSENESISLYYVGEAPKPTLHIFSVGVSDYGSKSLTKLGYASKDATDFVKTVTASDLSLYDKVASPVVLTDKSATKSNIEKDLSKLVRDVEQDDVVMLFFSGHGVMDGNDAYFMSVDADGDEPYTGVDFSLIKKSLLKMTDKHCRVVIFMDACHSGAMFSAKSSIKPITFADSDIIGFYSSSASQTSAEFKGDENGVFTKALIEALKGKAKNADGEITTNSLQSYISDYVSARTNGRQSAIVENKQGNIVLYNVKK